MVEPLVDNEQYREIKGVLQCELGYIYFFQNVYFYLASAIGSVWSIYF
jgi:hypothetical protein